MTFLVPIRNLLLIRTSFFLGSAKKSQESYCLLSKSVAKPVLDCLQETVTLFINIRGR